jgi:hypothetical protein
MPQEQVRPLLVNIIRWVDGVLMLFFAGNVGSSGFGFMGGSGSSKASTSGGDSFSFVSDAMKAQKQ